MRGSLCAPSPCRLALFHQLTKSSPELGAAKADLLVCCGKLLALLV